MVNRTNRAFAVAPDNGPRLSRTIDGFEYNPTDDVWTIPSPAGATSFNFINFEGASERLRQGIKEASAAMLLSIAPERVMKVVSAIRVLIRFLVAACPSRIIDEIGVSDVLAFAESLSKRQRYLLRRLKEHLLIWSESGAYGLSDELRKFLPKMETESHVVGAAVRTMDPNTGPLTDMEYESVVSAIRQAYATGSLNLADYTLLVLALSLAARPLQLAMLKTKDFSELKRSDGSSVFILQVTRLKQGTGVRPRTLFRARELAPAVGMLVKDQCAVVHRWAKEQGILPDEAPIFPTLDSKHRQAEAAVLGLERHMSGKNLCEKLTRLLNKLSVQSHRTGQAINLFQTRLRRTLGTRAAAEGLRAEVIADLMDHSWIDSSLVYIETRPAIIERIDKALALQMAPLAQAFAGTLAKRPEKMAGKVVHYATSTALDTVGGCGKYAFCGLAAPLACYTCSYFNPWLDAPHEALLERLLSEREELLQMSDLRMAAVNDRTILAVAEVVSQCAEARRSCE